MKISDKEKDNKDFRVLENWSKEQDQQSMQNNKDMFSKLSLLENFNYNITSLN